MDNPDSGGCSGAVNPIYFRTSLDTSLLLPIPDTYTVSDLQKKFEYEHPRFFPKIGKIVVNAIKGKKNKLFYVLCDYMLVKDAFRGVSRSWFLSVDASTVEEHRENRNLIKSDTGNGINNSSADVVDLVPCDTAKRLPNANNALVLRDGDDSTKENLEDSRKEAEHLADSNSQVSFPAKLQPKDVGDDKICEDHGPCLGLNDVNLGDEAGVDETFQSSSSLGKKKPATRKRMANKGTEVPGEHPELETNEHKDVSCNDREYKSKENSLPSGHASKKKRKVEEKYGNEKSLIDNGEQATGPDTATSKSSLDQRLESTAAVIDHLNTESLKQNQLSATNASGGKKKRRRQKSNPSQAAGNDVASAKDVHADTFQAIDASKDKDLGSKSDPDSCVGKRFKGGEVSPLKMQEVSETNRVPQSGGDNDMDDINDGNLESKNEALEPAVSLVTKPIPVSQKSIDFRKAFGASGHGNQSEENMVEPKKSSKKVTKSRKSKGRVGGTEVVDAVHNRGPASNGTIEGKEEAKVQNADCSPSFTDLKADDVIQDVLESLNQCNNDQANAENANKKSKKKSKKKNSSVVAPPELQGKDDVDHLDCNNSKEVPGGSEMLKSQQKHEIADSETVVETAVKGKKNLKPELPTSELTNGNKCKKAKAEAVKSSSVQSQISLSKTEPSSTNVKSSKPLLTLSVSVRKEPLQSNRFDKIDSTPKNAQGPIDINSSRAHTDLKKNNSRAVSSSALETPKNTINLKEGGTEQGHDDKESSDGEDGVGISDSSTRTPSGNSSSDYSVNHENGKSLSNEVETAMKGKKNLKPELPSLKLLNGNKHKEAKAQAVKSSSIQSQRSLSKAEPNISNVKSSMPLLTVSKSRSGKVDSTPKNSSRPVDINPSRAHTGLKENNSHAVSSSAVETPKTTSNLKKGGKELQSHLNIAKATESNSLKVGNNLANKKSLLATPGTIFRHDDKESSDDEDGVSNSDSGTRTPSESSSSSDDSGNSHDNGSYNKAGGRNNQKPGSSSPKKRLTLDAILRNSSSYKKAKLTAAQDIDSQPEEFVPESQAT